MSNAYQEFNQQIKDIFKLFKDLPSQRYKSKLHISEMQSKLVQGMNAEEKYAMTFLGPVVWAAREEIATENEEFFLNRRYEMELQKLSKQHKFNYDNAVNTVAFMKDAYRQASSETKQEIFRNLKRLLTIYSKFALNTQN